MKRFLVSIVCITLVLMLLCLAGTPNEAAAQKDTLVIGMQDKSQSFDPATAYCLVGWKVFLNVYDKLVAFQEGDLSQIVPQLAESWDLAADGKTWIFHLRKGATFASGNPVNADAVVFSLRRFVKVAGPPSWLLTQFGISEDSITKIDEETVQIVLDQQYSPALFLSCLAAESNILDPDLVLSHEQDGDLGSEWLRDHSAGAGPYTIEEHQPDMRVVLNTNKRYWGTKPPAFERITLTHIGESAEQAALLQAGEIDIAQNLTTEDIQMLGSDPEVQIFQTHGSNIIYFNMNLGYEPFANSKVRDALRYAIDYDGIVAYVLGGAAIKHQGFIPKDFLGYTPDTPYTQDVERAKHLLTEGGYPEGFEVELKCLDFSPWLELAMKLKEDLAQIGVIVRIMPVNDEQLWDASFVRRDFQVFLWHWYYDYADTDANAKAFAHCDSAGDDATVKGPAWTASYVNPETSKLVEQAAQESDLETRRALYEQINAMIVDDGPFAFLYTPIIPYAIRTEVVQSLGAPEYRNEFMILQ